MSGQLLRAKTAREKAPKHTHVVITFTQGGLLRFVDPRTFGEMFVTEYDDIDQQVEELAHLGLDPLETAMSWDLFGRMLAERKTKLKSLLMDQKFIAGIGNVYSDEILFQAGLKWERQSDSLSQQEVRRLYRAIFETLQDAVKYRGSSLADEQYVDLFGQPGEYQEHHQVYDREGEACPRCRRPCTGPASPTARPSTARHVRSDRLADPRAACRRDRPACRACSSATRAATRRAARARARVGPQPRRRLGRGRVRGRRPAVDRMIAWCRTGPPARPGRRRRGRADRPRRRARLPGPLNVPYLGR